MWTPRGRRPVQRFFAHRLLVVTPLPMEGQAWVIAFPFSLGWSFGGEAKTPAGGGAGVETPISVPHDPQGNVTSFERSQYENPATGETAIGPGGGTVKGAGGVELRLPSGAVTQGVRLKIALATEEEIAQAFTEEQLAKLLPGTTLGSVLKIESPDQPTFEKEVDVAFPVPDFTKAAGPQPTNPKDAYYYVHKRVESKDASGKPIVLFQVVDEAVVEGEGEKARIVTASPPFPGFESSLGLVSFLLMSWSFDVQNPGKPLPGRIVGKVLRQVWDENAPTPTYEAVPAPPGAKVSTTDASGIPLWEKDGGKVTYSGSEGTYALWDERYAGGTITVVAEYEGARRDAVAFDSLGTDRYKPYPHDARANITFPAVRPPPTPPMLEVRAFRSEGGKLGKEVDGITVVRVPLLFGIQNNSKSLFTVNGATINGEVRSMKGPLKGDPSGFTYVTDEEYAPAEPGTYTFRATALRADGPAIPVSWTFRAIADGGDGVDTVAGPPRVLPGLTAPQPDAAGIPVDAFVRVAFSEPVRNIPDNVTLEDAEGKAVPLRISGVRSGVDPVVVDPLTSEQEVVTSLTIQPLTSLKYKTKYTLRLRPGIVDLDAPVAQTLPLDVAPDAYVTSFTTFGPTTLTKPGEGETFISPGMVVMGDRAYLARNYFMNGTLVGFNVENPTAPALLAGQASFSPRPVDVVGLQEDAISKGRLVVVATGSTNTLKPASLLLFDVTSDEQFRWIGVSSVVSSGQDGFIARVAVKGGYAYTATMKKGIQVVDLQEAVGALGTQYFDAQWAINTEGRGWGQQAVVQTIGVPKNGARDYWLNDIDVADMGGRTLGVVTGEMGIAVADTGIGSFLFPGTWPGEVASADGQTTLGFSYVSALGRLSDKDVAAVVGLVDGPGGGRFGLAVVDLTDPAAPVLLGWTELVTGGLNPTDVILKSDQAFVGLQGGSGGRTLVVSLANLSQPRVVGTIEGVGGRLAVGDNGILYGSAYSPFGGNSPVGGIRTAALGPILLVLDKDKNILPRIKLPRNSDMFVRAIVPGAGETINVDVSVVKKDGSPRPATPDGIPTETTLTLVRDSETGYYDAPLRVVDKDCAVELGYDEAKKNDEQIITKPCEGQLESGPWTQLKVTLESLERITDMHAFRLVTLGDSLTQGVQHGIVVHQDQRHSYPAQLAGQINEYLKKKYGQQVVFKQAMIAEPGIGKPPLRNPHGDGNVGPGGFPVPGRLNPTVQPVNNLGMSGSRVAHLHTAKEKKWPTYMAETPWTCQESREKCEKYPSPIDNPDEPKSVWRYVLAPPESQGESFGTAVDQACQLDPSLLLVFIGNNDALNAPVGSDMRELTSVGDFQDRYNALMEAVQRCTEGRADVMVGTIPDVASIPHMRNVGDVVGALPFTLPELPEKALGFDIADPFTRQFEKIFIEPQDENDECLGNDQNGACLGGDLSGAKIGIGTLGKTLVVQDLVSLGSTMTLVLSQAQVMRRLASFKTIRLKQGQVMRPRQLQEVQFNVDAFNRHITGDRWAAGHGWPVMDMNKLFKDRTTDGAKNEPTLLNGLFTGTPRPVRREGDLFRRGMGNTMLGWDGVHPNSAGYSVVANVAIGALQVKLDDTDYGGLEKGALISLVPPETTTRLLKEDYLSLKWSRVYGWQDLLSTVR